MSSLSKQLAFNNLRLLRIPFPSNIPPRRLLPMTESDSELVARTLKGDRQAFDELVERYQKLVFSIAYRIVVNVTESEDLVQSIFLRAYSGLKSFQVGTD